MLLIFELFWGRCRTADREHAAKFQESGLTLDYTPGCSFYRGAKIMQIGIVAKKIGLSVDAIRFYERNALLPRPPRTQGGFRRYSESDVDTLAFIRRVQRCATDWKKSSLMYSGNLPTFTSWSTSCVWLCAVATKSCASDPLIAQF